MDCHHSNFNWCTLHRSCNGSPERLVAKPRQYSFYNLVFPDPGSRNDNRQRGIVPDLFGRYHMAVYLKEKL